MIRSQTGRSAAAASLCAATIAAIIALSGPLRAQTAESAPPTTAAASDADVGAPAREAAPEPEAAQEGEAAAPAQDGDGEATAFQPPETRIDYDLELFGAPNEEIAAIVEASLRLYRQQEDGAQSLAFLRRRAAGDVETVARILRSFGYYSGAARMRVLSPERRAVRAARRARTRAERADEAAQAAAPQPAASPPAPAATDAAATDAALTDAGATDAASTDAGATVAAAEAPARALVEVRIEPGPVYALSRHDFIVTDAETVGAPTLGPAQAYGSPVGEAAAAAPILSAEGALVSDLRRQARPYARTDGRRALADRDAATLQIDSLIVAGPAYVYGPMTFEGAPDIDEAYLRTYQPWKEGEPVDAVQLRDYQRALMSTRLFRTGRVELPDAPPDGPAAPVSVVLEQAPFRTFAVELFYNSDEGPGGDVSYEHRNLFGSNETLELKADTTIGEQIALARLSVPQYRRPGQTGVLQAELRNIEDDAYDERGGTLSGGIERRLSDRWTVGLGALAEHSIINDTGVDDAVANLAGLPAFAAYDGSNSLLDPTDGQRLRVSLTPFVGTYQDDPVAFGVIDASGTAYRGLDADDRFVAAGRLRLGSVLGESLSSIPATRRFYSGGGGSVRGYQKDFVGPIDRLNSPVGGRSVVEINAELRARVWGPVSVVGFVDAGSVAKTMFPSFDDGVQVAAGLGARYASPIGPIRLDVAVPLDPRRVDNAFEFYISIGQAF